MVDIDAVDFLKGGSLCGNDGWNGFVAQAKEHKDDVDKTTGEPVVFEKAEARPMLRRSNKPMGSVVALDSDVLTASSDAAPRFDTVGGVEAAVHAVNDACRC